VRKQQAKIVSPFCVLRLVLDTGERLPCLVDRETWLPVRLATRWAMRYRRYRRQSSTLADNLRILGTLYAWARTSGGFELDDYLSQGNILTSRQIEAFAATLRMPDAFNELGPTLVSQSVSPLIDAGTHDHYLSIVEMFLLWALDSMNRGGCSVLTLEQLSAQRAHLTYLFASLRMGACPSERMEPLANREIASIRQAIGPVRKSESSWLFPEHVWAPPTRLRNWLMFEMALELCVRRGELLKLRLDSLPRGSDDGIRILRHPDDPADSRTNEPAVKTAERVIPASRTLLSALRAYITLPPPLGRVRGKSLYLFVTEKGYPLSLARTDDVIQDAGRYSGVVPLSWHRLRHTWSEQWATRLLDRPNGKDVLQYLGGWTNPHSPDHYIQHTIAQQAAELVRAYQQTLYVEGA
jgi:integrase